MNLVAFRRVRRGTKLRHTPTGHAVKVLHREGSEECSVAFCLHPDQHFIARRQDLEPFRPTLRK